MHGLLNLSDCRDEVARALQIRLKAPVQKNEEQKNEGDYDKVFQSRLR